MVNPGLVGETTIGGSGFAANAGVLWRRHERISDFVLIPTCNVTLRSAAYSSVSQFPLIADPQSIGNPGDISLGANPTTSPDFTEFDDAVDAARNAWIALGFSSSFGLTAISINRFVDSSGAPIGVLGLGGWSPVSCDAAVQAVIGRAMAIDPAYLLSISPLNIYSDDHETIFGQELLHGLTLDHNTTPGPFMGHNTDPNNLMYPYFPNGATLTSAQCDLMRAQAIAHVPGAMVDPVPEPFLDMRATPRHNVADSTIDIHLAGIARETGSNQTHFFVSTTGLIQSNASQSFTFMLDSDNDTTTGGSPIILGIPTAARGIEFVGRVTLTGAPPAIVTETYLFTNGVYSRIDDSRIRGVVNTNYVLMFTDRGHYDFAVGNIISLRIPDILLPPFSPTVGFRGLGRNSINEIDETTNLQLTFRNPTFPTCSVTPDPATNGTTVHITAQGLPPTNQVHILLGPTLIAAASTDASGNVNTNLTISIPDLFQPQRHLITIGVDGIPITADCGVTIIPQCPGRIGIDRAVIIRWACGTLQCANNVNGPWFDLPFAVSPYCVPTNDARRFYRVKE